MAQQEGKQLLRRVPEVDVVMGPQHANQIHHLLSEADAGQVCIPVPATSLSSNAVQRLYREKIRVTSPGANALVLVVNSFGFTHTYTSCRNPFRHHFQDCLSIDMRPYFGVDSRHAVEACLARVCTGACNRLD